MAASGLDLRAVEELLEACAARGVGTAMVPCGNLRALLVHVRALQAHLRLGRDLLMEHAEHLGAAEEVLSEWDIAARVVLGAAQDGEGELAP